MKTHLSIEKTPNVLIFDSGVGGLSVYDEISRLLPNVNYIYVFDNAAFPYGEKSESFIIERDLKLIEMIEQEYAIDLAVIACNTASTVVLPALRAKFKFPIVGVVPAIKPAVALTKNSVVGLLATKGTVMRSYTHDLIKQFATNCKVELLGSSRLVEIAEDKLHGKPIEIDEVKAIFSPWLQLKAKPDTIILGCTHFPLLMEELKIALPEKTQFVDSGAAIARRVAALISSSAHKNDVIDNSNITICTQLDKKVIALRPALERYRLGNLCEYRL